ASPAWTLVLLHSDSGARHIALARSAVSRLVAWLAAARRREQRPFPSEPVAAGLGGADLRFLQRLEFQAALLHHPDISGAGAIDWRLSGARWRAPGDVGRRIGAAVQRGRAGVRLPHSRLGQRRVGTPAVPGLRMV